MVKHGVPLNIIGLRSLVYGACALVVLACLALAIWALFVVVPQQDTYAPNPTVYQHDSPTCTMACYGTG
jgi:hypothetical protein